MSATAEAYLTIPAKAAALHGGARWSHGYDALEDATGQTIALVEQLDRVFDGVFSDGPVPHFVYVISLLRGMKFGSSDPQFARLHQAYSRVKDNSALARNAGVLIGELCRNLPWKLRPSLESVRQVLQARRRTGERRRQELAPEPPLPMAEFLSDIATRLAKLSDEDLYHSLRFGRGPVPESPVIEEVLDSLPVRVRKLLAAARQSPRLVGAASLVPALDAALTLPPRKRSPDALPQGGYADVTTHGDLDRLLPSQFALEPDDFIRRFAERELLYFKREEPQARQKPERVLVLDQGVRTWGSVRLALAGAALSLLKADPRRVGDVRVHFTSVNYFNDVRRWEFETLVEHLAASDLTPHPADAFVRALSEPGDSAVPRDFVLLTHPNNLPIPLVEVRKQRRPTDRIFAVTVAENGATTLHEFMDEGPRQLRSFRLNLTAAEAERVHGTERLTKVVSTAGWTGDVEPIGFPFRPGLVGEPQTLAFSAEGNWLVIGGLNGLLHALPMNGSPPEVLPRAFRDGVAFTTVQKILGVSDGVVVCGRMPKRKANEHEQATISFVSKAVTVSSLTFINEATEDEFVAAHYDFPSRHLRLYPLGSTREGARWSAFPEWHCIVLLTDNDEPQHHGTVVNLDPPEVVASTRAQPLSPGRPNEALIRARMEGSPPYSLEIVHSDHYRQTQINRPYLARDGNYLAVNQAPIPWVDRFELQSEGKPLLEGKTIESVTLAGTTLALETCDARQRNRKTYVIRGTDYAILSEHKLFGSLSPTLSPDGRRLARQNMRREIVVFDTAGAGPALAATAWSQLHNTIAVGVVDNPFSLFLRIGSFDHRFRIADDCLVHFCGPDDFRPAHTRLSPADVSTDPYRFQVEWGARDQFWTALMDRWGAVHLVGPGQRLVASFLIRRQRAAAWIPGGIFWGDAALIGGPPHPDAAALIGQAIRAAGRGPA